MSGVFYPLSATVTVCDQCHTSACWQGVFMCEGAREAGTVEMPVSALDALGLEHPDYYLSALNESSTPEG